MLLEYETEGYAREEGAMQEEAIEIEDRPSSEGCSRCSELSLSLSLEIKAALEIVAKQASLPGLADFLPPPLAGIPPGSAFDLARKPLLYISGSSSRKRESKRE